MRWIYLHYDISFWQDSVTFYSFAQQHFQRPLVFEPTSNQVNHIILISGFTVSSSSQYLPSLSDTTMASPFLRTGIHGNALLLCPHVLFSTYYYVADGTWSRTSRQGLEAKADEGMFYTSKMDRSFLVMQNVLQRLSVESSLTFLLALI